MQKTISSIPLPVQYLGSKARIASWILKNINASFPQKGTFVDLFAGTGSVGFAALINGYKVRFNDIQPYAWTINQATVFAPKVDFKAIRKVLTQAKSNAALFNGIREAYRGLEKEEKDYFRQLDKGVLDWKKYVIFCKQILPFSPLSTTSSIQPSGALMTAYFGNAYFGIRQALELDTIRALSDQLPQKEKIVLLGACLSAMSYSSSSTTHFAQFLKPANNATASDLLRRRKRRILTIIEERLEKLHRLHKEDIHGEAFNSSAISFLHTHTFPRGTVIYADPPYFKEHYSRYYHVLDTFVLYDYPKLSLDPVTKKISIGRYRENRITSDFGYKKKASHAFKELIGNCFKQKVNLVISYADKALVPISTINKYGLDVGYEVEIKNINLSHSGQGMARHRMAKESLLIMSFI